MAQGTSPTAARTQNTAFRTGAAARIITPPVGSVMGNSYGLAISEGVHDDLYAKALVFEKGSQKAVLVALDLISLPHALVTKTTTTVPLVEGGGALVSEVQAIAMGNEVVLVGFPGDAFVELGLSIKLNSPFPYTIVSEQSGNGTTSYMPNRKAFPEGGYEVISARYSPGGGEILVGAVNRMLTDLFFNE